MPRRCGEGHRSRFLYRPTTATPRPLCEITMKSRAQFANSSAVVYVDSNKAGELRSRAAEVDLTTARGPRGQLIGTRPADHVIDGSVIVGGIFHPRRMQPCPSRPLVPPVTPPPLGAGRNGSNGSHPAITPSSRSVPPRASPSPTSNCGGGASPDPFRRRPSCPFASHRLRAPRPRSNWRSLRGPSFGSPRTSARS
jgi:hypothetical protein